MEFVFRRSYRGPLKAAVLDWAGTTVDYGCLAPAVVFLDVFKENGVEVTMDEAREPMGAHKRAHIQRMLENPAIAKRWEEAHGQPAAEADIDRLYSDFIPKQTAILADYADLIPGTLETCKAFRERGMKIGSSTGYTQEMMDLLGAEAKKRGYEPDAIVPATAVPAGRPAPWMMYKNAMELGVYPMEAVVKIGDTLNDIYSGLNAGAWTIGLAVSGNMAGLSKKEMDALDPADFEALRERACQKLAQAGAHFVVDAIGDVPPVLDAIECRLAQGERP